MREANGRSLLECGKSNFRVARVSKPIRADARVGPGVIGIDSHVATRKGVGECCR